MESDPGGYTISAAMAGVARVRYFCPLVSGLLAWLQSYILSSSGSSLNSCEVNLREDPEIGVDPC